MHGEVSRQLKGLAHFECIAEDKLQWPQVTEFSLKHRLVTSKHKWYIAESENSTLDGTHMCSRKGLTAQCFSTDSISISSHPYNDESDQSGVESDKAIRS